MPSQEQQELLKRIPPVTELLKSDRVAGWLKVSPLPLVTDCLRKAAAATRDRILDGKWAAAEQISVATILEEARGILERMSEPRLTRAINATGIILHTGLGRAVFPSGVVDSIIPELKGYSTLAVDRQTNERIERDELVESIL